MNTFEETQELLKLAIVLSHTSIKQIAEACGIRPNTLYKWKTNDKVHLSPAKSDALLLYFQEKEPHTLIAAAVLERVLIYIDLYLTSSTNSEVAQEE